MYGYAAVVSTLLKFEAFDVQVGSVDTEYKRTPLCWAVVGACETARQQSVASDDADYGRYLDHDNQYQSPSRPDHVEVIRILFEAGADLDAKDKTESTALHYAVKELNQDLERCLVDLGANVNMRNADRKTPAQLAWERKHLDWSLYEVDQEETPTLFQRGNSEVAVLYKMNDAYEGPEVRPKVSFVH
jgi:hypothetical protein